jgi:hypothetical protein
MLALLALLKKLREGTFLESCAGKIPGSIWNSSDNTLVFDYQVVGRYVDLHTHLGRLPWHVTPEIKPLKKVQMVLVPRGAT